MAWQIWESEASNNLHEISLYCRVLVNCIIINLGNGLTHVWRQRNKRYWAPFINTLRPRQNDRCFADDTFKRIFLNENIIISIKISLKFVPEGPINNITALVQIMAWCRPSDKPLSEPRLVNLPMHICVIRMYLLIHAVIYVNPCQ